MIADATKFQTPAHLEYAGVDELWATESSLPRYNNSIVTMLARDFSTKAHVLEFGAGIGTLAQLWEKETGCKPECLEIAPSLFSIVSQRGFVSYSSLDKISGPYDGIYSSNVLEHIEDDVAALRHMYSLLKPGGCLGIYVPAFMCLYSEMDLSVGHYRRYSFKELTQKVKLAGFNVRACHYSDSVGFFAALAIRIMGYKKNSVQRIEKNFAFYDAYLYPLSQLMDRVGLKHAFGKNILLIAERI